MQLFFALSGYLYSGNKYTILNYIKKKMKRLLLPCWAYNIFYGLFNIVIGTKGFHIGGVFSFYNIFISSMMFGSNFRFNSPDWFIMQLFFVEIINVFISKLLAKRHPVLKYIYYSITLVGGLLSIQYTLHNEINDFTRVIFRTIFCLSWYNIGMLYKQIEKYDTLSNQTYFSIIFIVQFLILMKNDANVQGSVVHFNFLINPIEVYITALLAIAFWVRICKLISVYVLRNKFLDYVGHHTFTIVENQYLGFFFLNILLHMINQVWNIGFDEAAFYSMHNYIYLYHENYIFAVLYLIMGIGVPIVISYVWDKMKTIIVNVKE